GEASMPGFRPAWAWSTETDQSARLSPSPLLTSVTWEQALGGSTGRAVRVAIIDSGIDNTHPAVAGAVVGWAEPSVDEQGAMTFSLERHDDHFGQGTACAGIVHGIAPEAELYSVRVLGRRLSGKGAIFAAGLRWA